MQPNACTALISSFAEWLIFCGNALKIKDDVKLEVIDSRTVLPLIGIASDDYSVAAPWVTTRVRYGGIFGYCQAEREISLEELLQRAKVRTMSGRRANRKAAKQQLKRLKTARRDVATQLEEIGLSPDKTEAEIQELNEQLHALSKVENFARRKLQALTRHGSLFNQRNALDNLRFIDPTAGSTSLQEYESSAGKKGWLSRTVTFKELCYWYFCGCCHVCFGCVRTRGVPRMEIILHPPKPCDLTTTRRVLPLLLT